MQDNPFEYAIDNSSVVRNDASLMNVLTEMGTAGDTSLYTTPSTGKRFSPTQLELLHEAPLLNAFCSAIPDSAISKPFEFSFGGMDKQVDVKKVSEIADWLSEFGVPEKTAKAQTFANVYGGAAIVYFVDDGQAQDQPLDLSKLKKFVATRVLDCQKVTPFLDTVTTLDDITYYDVSTHGLNFDTPNDANKGYIRFHKSRIIPFYGLLLTDNAMLQRYQAWGKSTIEAIWESYRDYRTGILASSGNLGDSSLAIISMEGFIELLRANDTETIKNVFNSVRQMASNQKMMLIDKDKQKIEYVERQFTGVSQVIDKLREDFIGQTRIPHDKLFGESPSGLGATGEAEEKNWAKEVRQFQERRWRKALKKQYEILLSLPDSPLKGKLPKQWTFTFPSILELTQEEEINNKTAQSNIDSTYSSLGVLTVDEIRESRFGGTTFSYDTTLDQKAYEAEKKKQEQQAFGGFGGFGGFGQEEEAPVETEEVPEEEIQQDSLRIDSEEEVLYHDKNQYNLEAIEKIAAFKPIEEIPVANLAWILDFAGALTFERVMKANIAQPIIVVFKRGRPIVIDGMHRLQQAQARGIVSLPAKVLTPLDLASTKISEDKLVSVTKQDTMRPSCMDCVTKHLGSALVLGHEVENGYPHHIIEMVGQLHEAEKEVEDFSKEAAGAIRDLRRTCWSEHRSPMQEEVMQIYALLGYEWAQGFATQEEEIELPSYRMLEDSLPLRSLEHQDILSEDEFLLSDLADEYIFWDELNDEDPPRVQNYEFIKEQNGEPVYRKLPIVERHAPAEIELFEDDCNLDSAPSKYSHINFVPPEAVRNAAARGLAIRKEQPKSNRGGLTNKEASKEGIGSGVQRAVNLKNGGSVSPKVVRQMKAFFDRHSAFKHKHKSEPEGKARVSWLLWGGDAGYSWAKKVVGQMEAADKSERRDAIARFNKKNNESLTEDSLLTDLRQDSVEPIYEWVEGYNRGDSWVPGYVRYYRDRKGTPKKKVQLDAQEEELPIDLSIELSIQRGQPVIDEWIKLLGEEIGKEKSLEALLEKIPDLASKLSIENFGEIMQEGNMLSHLLGLTEEDL